MKRGLILVGAGPFARELREWITQAGLSPDAFWKGFLFDGEKSPPGSAPLDLPCLGSAESYLPAPEDELYCALLEPARKLHICAALRARGGRFERFIHRYAVIERRIAFGEGCILSPRVEITADVSLGDFVTVRSFTSLAHDVSVGRGCTLGSHCDITGNVVLGEGVLVQPHGVVLPGMRIGNRARIGAGSVVVRDVAAGQAVWGVPAIKADPAAIQAF